MSRPRRPIRVSILSSHPPTFAGTRIRAVPLVSLMDGMGFDVSGLYYIPQRMGPLWERTGRIGRGILATMLMPRGLLGIVLAIRADVVIVRKEAWPFAWPIVEWVGAKCSNVIWDIDDAEWLSVGDELYSGIRRGPRKWVRLARYTSAAWAGNVVIAEWLASRVPRVRVVETIPVMDVPRPVYATGAESPELVVGWIGSSSTYRYLEPVLEGLDRICRERGASVVVCGAPRSGYRADLQSTSYVDWSIEAEAMLLRRMDLGLYVLSSEDYAQAKSAFKVLLYMNAGIPQVAYRNRVTESIVAEGLSGYLVGTEDELLTRVEELLTDSELRLAMRVASRERFRKAFSRSERIASQIEDVREIARGS